MDDHRNTPPIDGGALRRRDLLLLGGSLVMAACGGIVASRDGSDGGDVGVGTDAASTTGPGGRVDAGPSRDAGAGPGGSDASTPDGSNGSGPGGGELDADASADGGSCSPQGNAFALPFSQYPQLAMVGGSARVNVPGYQDSQCGRSAVMVIHASTGRYVALSASCTFECCQLNYDGARLTCACHDGRSWDLSGQCSTGNAPALDVLAVCVDSTAVYVMP